MELNVTLDRKGIARFRTLLKANKMMAAKSLTYTAYKARDNWRATFPTLFHLRRRWLITGARVDNATPSRLQARVKHLDTYLGRHVKGIEQPKRAGGKSLFVPAQPVQEQGTHTTIRAMLRRAGQTKTKPKFRVKDMILRRVGKQSNAPVKLLGVLRKSVDIQPRFDALGQTERVVQREYSRIHEKLLRQWAERG